MPPALHITVGNRDRVLFLLKVALGTKKGLRLIDEDTQYNERLLYTKRELSSGA